MIVIQLFGLRQVKIPDKGDGIVNPMIVFCYIRLCYIWLEKDSSTDFELVAATLLRAPCA